MPDPHVEVVPGVRWGAPYEVPSAAYWALLADHHRGDQTYLPRRVGASVLEQYAYCVLGGYGMPAEVGVAAFERVRSAGLLSRLPTERECEAALAAPLIVGGRSIRYRFPKQKARYLAEGLPKLLPPLSSDPLKARECLRMLPGVGYKTASWIVRDWFASDDVAIIDVHIARACTAIGVFSARLLPERNYLEMEARFIAFANAVGARTSVLDNVMWTHMRRDGNVLGVRMASDTRPRPVNRKPSAPPSGPIGLFADIRDGRS